MLPPGLVIDHWQGRAYISLVGLRFERLRVFGIPALPRRYDEVNLRFYVRRPTDGDDQRPGVVFIRQIVPHRLTALLARSLYGEPFTAARMSHQFDGLDADESESRRRIAYHWQHSGRRQQFWAEYHRTPAFPIADSLDEFLTARYWGYNGKTATVVRTYHVTRLPWQVCQASRWEIDCDFSELCGGRLTKAMQEVPPSVLLASGSRATVSLPLAVSG